MPKPPPHKPAEKPAKPKPAAAPPRRLVQLRRHEALRALLRAGWKTHDELIARTGASRASVFRDLDAIGEQDALERETIAGRVSFRLPAKEAVLRVTTSQMVSLRFALNAMSFVAGTGIKEDLDEVVSKLSLLLQKGDYAHWKNLDRKLYDVNEMAYDYSDKLDVVNELVTALLREERLVCKMKDGRELPFEPYTLVLYKKGLYLLGYSETHKEVRQLTVDKIQDADRAPGERFEYPAEFRPENHLDGPFGLIRGKLERVVLLFDKPASYFATRRKVHKTQIHREVARGVEVEMSPAGIKEMPGWILSFGSTVEVLEPPTLREEVRDELKKALARYE